MGSKQLKAIGQSVFIVIWFYMVSFITSGLVGVCSKYPVQLLQQHSHLLNGISYIIIFLGIYLILDRRHPITLWKELEVSHIKEVILYIGMGIGTYLIGITITNLLINFFPEYHEINQSFNEYEPILRFVGMVLLPPLVEEYLFRDQIQGCLKKGFGKEIAIIGQALLFGMLHFYTLQKIYATILGILFGIVKEKQGIKATIWMHMTVNFIGWFMGCLINY